MATPTARTVCLGAPTLPLYSSRLVLRMVEAVDTEPVTRLAGDREVASRTLNIPHPMTADDAANFVADCRRQMAAGTSLILSIVEKRTGGTIGLVGVHWTDDRARGEVGYWLGLPHWRHGFMSEAMGILVPFLFENLGLARLEANVFIDNDASRRVLEKSGFQPYGRREQAAPVRGRSVVLDEYALDRDDWRERRRRARPVVLVAAVALIDDEGRVLVAQRPEGKHLAGLWEFPGGKVATGETPEAALVRELKEELDIDVAETCLSPLTFASHPYENFHLLMPVFGCRVWSGVPRPLEGQAIRWVRPSRLGELAMPPADVPLVALLQDLI